MAHFAKIENNLVVKVIVADEPFVSTLTGVWVQTSYNTSVGKYKLGKDRVEKDANRLLGEVKDVKARDRKGRRIDENRPRGRIRRGRRSYIFDE